MSNLVSFRSELKALGSPEKAKAVSRFFKSGPGQYGEGDVFIGVSVPEVRNIAKRYYNLSLDDAEELLMSPIHEERFSALVILVHQFDVGDQTARKDIYNFYLSHTKWINNWDLVDSSAEFIVGPWLQDKDRRVLQELAHSSMLWERRIAVLATFHYIKQGESDEAIRIISVLLRDDQDLIHKACGWMLREIGKRCSEDTLRAFLDKHYKTMPRTMLRYAIERFPRELQGHYLNG